MISALVADTWQTCPGADDIIVPVVAGNAASWRALERAGFARIAEGQMTPDNPIDPPDHYLYAIRRASSATAAIRCWLLRVRRSPERGLAM